MTDFRSKAEEFVTEFLDYVQTTDILDSFDKASQKMVRSVGVEALIKKAQVVFPPRVDDGKSETDKLTDEAVTSLIDSSNGVVLDRRDVFSKKIQKNRGYQGLMERVLAQDPDAMELARELVAADAGEKEFEVPK